MNEYSDFDLDRSTAQAWAEFQTRLAEVISVIDDSEDMTISTATAGDEPGPFIRFSSPRRHIVRCEAASNAVLDDDYQLTAAQLDQMQQLGWQAPTAVGADSTANFWVEDDQEASDRLSTLAVDALRDVYGVQHPVFLSPDQLAEILQPRPEPLDTEDEFDEDDVVAVLPRSRDHLDELVEAELIDMFGHPPLHDAEGDIAIRVGSTMLFLRTATDAREVIVFSIVVHDVEGRSRAMEVLNDLNSDARWVKFQLIRDRVFITLSIPGRPFVPAHLQHAVRTMSEVADGIDNELAAKLRGRTTFDEDAPGPDSV
ncbi:T3SS (YopN, CesT) and YbjN peptide-binding chaperone 1 [Propionibacteriaceae bacterium Y2011]